MQAFEDLDDSDADKDYHPGSEENDSSSENETDHVTKQHGPSPEFRIVMEPPTERPDAETDCDSGKLIIT